MNQYHWRNSIITKHFFLVAEGAADEHITLKREIFNHQSTISSQLDTYAF